MIASVYVIHRTSAFDMFVNKIIYNRDYNQIGRHCFAIIAILALLFGLVFELQQAILRFFPDSMEYLELAKTKSIAEALFSIRPFFSILFFKLVVNHSDYIFYLQVIIYFFSCAYLCIVLATLIQNTVLLGISYGVFIYLALYPDFVLWIKTALTESVSLSLAILSLALFLNFLHRKKGLFLLVVCLIVSANFRDFNAYCSLLYIVPLAIGCLWKKTKMSTASVAFGFIMAGSLFAMWSANHVVDPPNKTRGYFSMLDNVGPRVLTNPVFVEFFEQQGMPNSQGLMAMKGLYAFDNNFLFYRNTQINEFKHWLQCEGKRVYTNLLWKFPHYTFSELWTNRASIFQYDNFAVEFYTPLNFSKLITTRYALQIVYCLDFILLFIFCTLALRQRSRDRMFRLLLGASYFFLCLPMALIAYHADSQEVARHCLMIPFHALLSLMVLIYLVDDRSTCTQI